MQFWKYNNIGLKYRNLEYNKYKLRKRIILQKNIILYWR
jgi:hypothetical protein